MANGIEHQFDVDGPDPAKVGRVTCGSCKNSWYVTAGQEQQPSFCCYCGIKFKFYDDPGGVLRNIAGFEIDTGGDDEDVLDQDDA